MAATDPPAGIHLVETHISTLFFAGDLVYKLKKPVRTEFVDFSTVEARAAACHREVELNRRLAPDVYLGVAELAMDGRALDHFVVMRHLPASRRLAAQLDAPDVGAQLDEIARIVADFHDRAERGPHIDANCTPDALLALWRTGVDQLRPFVPDVLDRDQVDRMDELAREYIEGRNELIRERIEAGRACDGHGDLLAEDVFCMQDGPRILDCLEFDDALRHGDVLADVAFLAMDLERLGRPDLAARFLATYRELSGDRWPDSLAHLHIAYRAHVRSKVTCLRHAQGDPGSRDLARSLHRLALDHLEAARVRLVLVGGAPGTGKTKLARGLAERTGATRVSTDDLRGEVVPGSAGAPGRLHEQRYAPEQVSAVYDAALSRAATLLARGESVVLDASWSSAAARAHARELAASCRAAVDELQCDVAEDVAAERIRARARKGTTTSEVTVEVAASLRASRDPWPEATVIDTSGTPQASLDEAARRLSVRSVPGAGHDRTESAQG